MATIEKKEDNVVHFTMEIDWDVFADAVEKAYQKNKNKIAIPGFRKGKVPRQIIERHFGKDVFYQDALDIAIPSIYEEAVKEMDIIPVDYPTFDIEGEIEKDNPVRLKGQVEVPPEIKLNKYKGLEVEKIEYEVTDELVDSEIESAREKNARIQSVEGRAVKEGDVLNIDYQGFLGDEAFAGGTAQDQTLEIGSGQFIPGFEEGLIGKSKGEEVELLLTFPEEYHSKDLAGKETKFIVTINDIKEKILPELDDEFVKDVSEFDTLKEYREFIKEDLEKQFKEKEESDTELAVLSALVKENDFSAPKSMVRNQVNEEINNFSYQMQAQGIRFEDYLRYTGGNIEMMQKQFEPIATMKVKEELILHTIAKEEDIKVSDEDLNEELEKAASYLRDEDKEKYKEHLMEHKDRYEARILLRKALEIVKDSAIFKDKVEEE